MNYDEMSDYEINKAVGIAKGFPPNTLGHIEHVLKFGAIAEYVTDFCGNSCDYMLLARESNMHVRQKGEKYTVSLNTDDRFICHECSESNLGRTICILYLELARIMKAKKNRLGRN